MDGLIVSSTEQRHYLLKQFRFGATAQISHWAHFVVAACRWLAKPQDHGSEVTIRI